MIYYAHQNYAGRILLKTHQRFKDQGGLTQGWGKAWVPIEANSIHEASAKAKEHFNNLVSPPLDLFGYGADARKWAEAFVRTAKSPHFEVPNLWDEGFMTGWFANAIEAARMADQRESSLYREVVRYLFGEVSATDWRKILNSQYTPPLPVLEHIKAWGFDGDSLDSKDQKSFRRGYDAGLADGVREKGRSAWQPWVHQLSVMQQSVLASAVRAPDGMRKFHPAKMLVRWYRRSVLMSAFDGHALTNPYEEGGGSFTGPLMADYTMEQMADEFMIARDEMSLHYYAHMMHAAQIVGCYHPEVHVQEFWSQLYQRMVNALHLSPETNMAMARRLSDSPKEWEARSDETASCTD